MHAQVSARMVFAPQDTREGRGTEKMLKQAIRFSCTLCSRDTQTHLELRLEPVRLGRLERLLLELMDLLHSSVELQGVEVELERIRPRGWRNDATYAVVLRLLISARTHAYSKTFCPWCVLLTETKK